MLELVLEVDELVEELGVDVLDALYRLVMDLRHLVLLRHLLSELLGPVHAL